MREGASIPRRARLARQTEPSPVCDVDFDLIPFLESERLDHDGGKANCKAIPPLRDLHAGSPLLGYTFYVMYIHSWQVKEVAGNTPAAPGKRHLFSQL